MSKPKPAPKPAAPLTSYVPEDYRKRLFLADFAANRNNVRRFGKTAEEALVRWMSGALKGRASTQPVARAPTVRAPAPRAPTPAPTYRFRPGDKLVGRKLPHWPVFECTRPTNDTPGVSTAWRLVGREA